MRQKTSQLLYVYWNDIRGGRLAPKRFDVEPGRIASVLSETFILEITDDGRLPYRLAGTRICELFGTEFRGHSFFDGWGHDDRETLMRLVEPSAEHGGVIVFSFEAIGTDTTRRVAFEGTLLPLLHQGSEVGRFLGSLSPLETPAWLGTERLKTLRLLDHELIWPDGRPHAMANQMRLTERAVHKSVNLSALPGARIVRGERRAFRVVEGGLKSDV